MIDTLEHKEYIIINKLAYHIGKPERGDVVVFRPPNQPKKHYVKRIIGTPGDIISIRDGLVYITPKDSEEAIELSEDYLNDRSQGQTFQHPPTSGNKEKIRYEVPGDHYFLLGDNRKGSLDSRSFTPTPFVSEDNIKGRVWFVALPVSKIHALEPPDYGL